jgi:hypothetical protein
MESATSAHEHLDALARMRVWMKKQLLKGTAKCYSMC